MAAKARFDLTIIGGGIIGLATARQVASRHPKLRVCVLEKEKELATHQSKRNSGVVHCGIYYKRRSLKSQFCLKGAKLVKEYCQTKGLPYKQCGKLIVPTSEGQLESLHNLFRNAQENHIEGIKMITAEEVAEIQPGCLAYKEAIWSANTAIVDWHQVALSYADDFVQLGGKIITDYAALGFEAKKGGNLIVKNGLKPNESVETKSVVNCAGLFSDFFARKTSNYEHPKVVPFRGHYYILGDRLAKSIKTNIYPVPDPKLPFLGVHITPRIDGSVLVGPTAMLSFGYEKYEPEVSLSLAQMYHILWRSGLRKMLKDPNKRRAALMEYWKYLFVSKQASEVREFLPDLKTEDLIETNFSGIRAQCVGKDGELVDDFLFETGLNPDFNRVLHVRNCPSPAATSSLALAERIVNILEERLI